VNVLAVSGLWPPDVGGPATHTPEMCDYLLGRGHGVTVVTMADGPPARRAYPIRWASRRGPLAWRHAAVVKRVVAAAAGADVVYATGMVGRASLGAALARKPIVLKLSSDPAFERAFRWGLVGADPAEFRNARGLRAAVLRRTRDAAVARAARLIIPSEAVRKLALDWGVPAEKIAVIPNPVTTPDLADREELRSRYGFQGPTFVYAGRMVAQKAIPTALEAAAELPDVSFVLAGNGPELDRLQGVADSLGLNGRVRFLGAKTRHDVFELLRAADAALLCSRWENFPHMVLEALAVGTPVVATDVGGVTEILDDGRNGLVVPTNDVTALAAAIRRYVDDEPLQLRLRAGTAGCVGRFAPAEIHARIEGQLLAAAGVA
jgi:glycosyltransferase involved in cell wall biosynthesis